MQSLQIENNFNGNVKLEVNYNFHLLYQILTWEGREQKKVENW